MKNGNCTIQLFIKKWEALIFLFLIFLTPSYAQKAKTLRWGNAYVDSNKVVITAFKSAAFAGESTEILIYRANCPNFGYSRYYDEYFYDLHFSPEDCIFKGNIDPILGAKFRYEDHTVEKDSVYAYWIATPDGFPVGPPPC